ncbi:HEPN domain-containing protein, partial [Priestia megaterium]|uniref:HEPN domain-containing protein n=1 Tax=Priestia megaterium TaxID=1404 RepID=UPI000BC82CC4
AFQLALSNINIIIKKDEENTDEFLYDYLKRSGSPLMNYYASKDLDPFTTSGEIILNEKDLERVKESHALTVEYNRTHGDYKVRGEWKPNRWSYALEQYLSACRAMTIDEAVLSLITGLESLLVKGEGLLKFKVSLYASIILGDSVEERKLINKQIHFMYNLRSKIVHGEIDTVVKITSKQNIFERYFNLKDILGK